MGEVLLEVKGLYKSFGGLTAISAVSFLTHSEEIVGIIGPNGAGKTTLFNLLTGFLKADSGEILYKGQAIGGLRPHKIARTGLSRSFQLARLFPNMTVEQTLIVPQYFTHKGKNKKSAEDIQAYCEKLLVNIGLQKKKDHLVKSLTQGELKLLDIARSLATDPDLLLLDEPFSGLGYRDIQPLTALILRLRDSGLTLMVIEHKLKELMSFVDRVIVINFGKLIADGSPQEIGKNKEVIKSYLGEEEIEIGIA